MPTSHEPTILVVDDEPDVGRYIAATLSRGGFKAVIADGGKAALAHFRAQKREGREIDLVLTDIVMTDLQGTELASTLRALDPAVRLLYMTGSHVRGNSEGKHEMNLDPIPILNKPFTPAELIEAVHRALGACAVKAGQSGGEQATVNDFRDR